MRWTYWRSQGREALIVAAEFPATADHYARSRHFWRYRVMPIAGASEGFVPEDADLLIEGTETGRTIAENNLKILDTIYRSTTCLDRPQARRRRFDRPPAQRPCTTEVLSIASCHEVSAA